MDCSRPRYAEDGTHPNPRGSYLAAVVLTAVLLRYLPDVAPVATSAGRLRVSQADQALLHERAVTRGAQPTSALPL